MAKKYSRLTRIIMQVLAGHDVRTEVQRSFVDPKTQEYAYERVSLADVFEPIISKNTIKRSELDKLRSDLKDVTISRDQWRNNWLELQARLTVENQNCSQLDAEAANLTKLLAEASERIEERNTTVAKLLHNGINLAAEIRKERADHQFILRTHDRQIQKLHAELEQYQVQFAGIFTAASGWNQNPAKPGDYGWSPAYQDVLNLRRRYEQLLGDTVLLMATPIIHFMNKPAEHIEPPACLKPKDALTYIHGRCL